MSQMSAAFPPPNYDEERIPPYVLPDVLLCSDGTRINSAEQWMSLRRPELLDLFRQHVYGHMPSDSVELSVEQQSYRADALDGLAERREVRVTLRRNQVARWFDLLLYLPNERSKPAPIFLGLNFQGNHAISPEPDLRLAESWLPNDSDGSVVNNRATERARGRTASRWPLRSILGAGYGLATIYYGDLAPDHLELYRDGVMALFPEVDARDPHAWRAIGAWAWGLSRALDACEQLDGVDGERVMVIGHSRLGKAALWAAANDQRFAAAISNNSGCGGASLSRRIFGETVAAITTRFPHWFCGKFSEYSQREHALPIDQHELLALVAPRPLYVASAAEDRWADPHGEWLSAQHASAVYDLFERSALSGATRPAVGEALLGTVSYHIRAGRHDLTAEDWTHYLRFAKQVVGDAG
jgi:hypothetical protein